MLHTFMTTQPFKLHFTDTEQYFLRPPGLLSVTFTDTRQSISGVDPPHHGKIALIYPQILNQRLSPVRSAEEVFALVDCHSEVDVDIWTATMASTSFQLDEKVANLRYRRGPGQPLSSSLARRVRVPASSSISSSIRFVEYVDIGALTYLKAPGPSCGAEGRWRNVALTGSASV